VRENSSFTKSLAVDKLLAAAPEQLVSIWRRLWGLKFNVHSREIVLRIQRRLKWSEFNNSNIGKLVCLVKNTHRYLSKCSKSRDERIKFNLICKFHWSDRLILGICIWDPQSLLELTTFNGVGSPKFLTLAAIVAAERRQWKQLTALCLVDTESI